MSGENELSLTLTFELKVTVAAEAGAVSKNAAMLPTASAEAALTNLICMFTKSPKKKTPPWGPSATAARLLNGRIVVKSAAVRAVNGRDRVIWNRSSCHL